MNQNEHLITVVVPCFNEEESLPHFYEAVSEVLQSMPVQYEFEFVNDGSSDHTLDILHELSKQDSRVFYESFSRNFGKEAAMLAGLHHARGHYVVLMDADLQHPPKLLKIMYETIMERQVDCVGAKRTNREGEGHLRNYLSRSFYRFINHICSVEMDDGAGDFRMMNRQMVNSLLTFQEVNRYSKGLFSYIGFDTLWIPYENVERTQGTSKWSMKALFAYAVEGITAFSNVPLLIAAGFGALFCLLALILFIYMLISGFDRTMILGTLLLVVGGIQLLFIGVLGEYLAKNVAESRHRPMYIIKESNRHAK